MSRPGVAAAGRRLPAGNDDGPAAPCAGLPVLLTRNELAKLFRVQPRTITERSKTEPGFPQPIRTRGRLYFRLTDVEEFLATKSG